MDEWMDVPAISCKVWSIPFATTSSRKETNFAFKTLGLTCQKATSLRRERFVATGDQKVCSLLIFVFAMRNVPRNARSGGGGKGGEGMGIIQTHLT